MTKSHIADRFLTASQSKGAPVCVGLDPVLERLPDTLQGSALTRIESWCLELLEAVAPYVPAVKPQAACFERYGAEGYAIYQKVVRSARNLGILVVGDAKRGDIGTSSAHYAAGMISGDSGSDWLTVNGYLGADGVSPFYDVARTEGKGVFVLVRTSNPGGDAIQRLRLEDGRSISEAVGDVMAELGSSDIGESGYSSVGFVVGATKPEDARVLRERYPQQLFLVPGYGAQGGTADDVRACFKPDGTGAIITASRSVIYAHQGKQGPWQQAVADGAKQLRDEIVEILN